MSTYMLEMKNITKRFPGVLALNNVTFSVKKGEIHCLVGENGAGKSTLMKILSGVYPHGQFEGSIIFDGNEAKFSHIHDSEKAGIGIIYQELALVPEMMIYENILLGHEIQKGIQIDIPEMIKKTEQLLEMVHLSVKPTEKIKELGIGKQQLVEIAKALSRKAKLLILDEPTAALNENDCENLLNIIRELKSQGVTCIMISHKLKEVMAIADTITVLRDGQTICTLDKKEATEQLLIKHMVGRSIENIYPTRTQKPTNETVLEIKNWSGIDSKTGRKILQNISLTINKGEIVGLAGLVGSGRTELARSIFGNPDGYIVSGKVIANGKAHQFTHPHEAIKNGIAYASEDRKKNGLILIQSIKDNILLANLKKISSTIGIIKSEEEIVQANEYVKSLTIKTPSIEQFVLNLSGGNQQKVSIAKWLFVEPKILILDEPTRGIDVGAKFEIYTLMNRLVAQGMSILMISSELPEVLGMSDRVYVVAGGKITGELTRQEATQERVMELATL
ncbi:MAG TPA: sugar ABC transporter ATP-binding protein [Spirochaetia bacterium]|nr:sugar ABC transporter ATP-binding protein [Spirochaetales bacterium]HQG39266.1 sugar ABC transporter ATP-binding protein [Spirochaetales bacterium]HQK33140.1 sugar ABC transporter ATP-binding protein [Spirochaetales bacterium]HRS64775.1 sugar ABC transporter ATP-binding protein [Spirochaetia bacterium]HRV27853.1 sugar ABC transporter ATP-binding protein [Spirochaetia bacterium]